MKYPKIEENIAAMKELLNWYETGIKEGEDGDCPLCVANGHEYIPGGEGCEACPYTTVAGLEYEDGELPCWQMYADIEERNRERNPDFLATRIPQLKEWIEVYEQALRGEGA